MAKLMRKALILAKLETVYATDPTPTPATDAILVRNQTAQPVTGDFVPRDVIMPYLGGDAQLPASLYSTIDFEVELVGSGTAGTAPRMGRLLRACGMSETITAGTSVVYAPVSGNFESASIYYYLDGLLHKLRGARGTVSFALNAKAIPVAQFRFTGMYSPVTDADMPESVDYSDFQIPQVVNNANTPSWSLHGYSGACEAITLDMGGTITYRNLIGQESVELTDRAVTGNATFELPAVAVANFPEIVRTAAVAPFSLVHGTVPGRVVKFDAPQVQLSSPSYQDSEGTVFMSATMSLVPNTGNDELIVTFA